MIVGERAIEHRRFEAFPQSLRPGDVLVINETRVIRARLRGKRAPGGGAAEMLLLRPAAGGAFDPAATAWIVLARPGRKLRAGAEVRFGDDARAIVRDVLPDGSRVVDFSCALPFEEILERYGELPLPPYVGAGSAARAERYQTVFARVPGSVAAPTASLHFTSAVLRAVAERGVEIVPLVLDIGLGTFKPLGTETIDEHHIHSERYTIPQATADAIACAKRDGRRIVAAGTTALRALEASAAASAGRVVAGSAEASLFITPGFPFRVADALLTNFHLPGSTLLVLVAAFAGYERIRDAYRVAVEERYRFFSFGDAMFLERDLLAK